MVGWAQHLLASYEALRLTLDLLWGLHPTPQALIAPLAVRVHRLGPMAPHQRPSGPDATGQVRQRISGQGSIVPVFSECRVIFATGKIPFSAQRALDLPWAAEISPLPRSSNLQTCLESSSEKRV